MDLLKLGRIIHMNAISRLPPLSLYVSVWQKHVSFWRSWPDWSRLALFQCLAYVGCLGIISSHPLYFPGLYWTQTRGMQRKSKSLKNAISFGTKAKPSSTLAKWSYQDLQEIFSNISNLGEDIPLRKIIYYIQNIYTFPSGTREDMTGNLSYCYWRGII